MRDGRSRRRRLAGAAAAVLVLLTAYVATGGIAYGEYYNPPPPGLPVLPDSPGKAWVKNGAMVTSPKAATAVRQPIQIQLSPDAFITDRHSIQLTEAWVFPTAGPDASSYGNFTPVQVKTLAFGSIPVSLTLYVSLPQDAAGLYRPLYISLRYDVAHHVIVDQPHVGGWSGTAALPTGSVDVRIDNVTVDGVPVAVGDHCQTATPAQLSADGRYWSDPAHRPPPPQGDEVPYFSVLTGGQLRGQITIPPFSGCRNGAEDLDPLFTTAVSGDALLQLTATGPSSLQACQQQPPPATPYCGQLDPLPLPTNPVHQH